MNYYERHLGDYAKDAGHLSMLEHGAYSLLLDRYYTTEQPIPADQARWDVYRKLHSDSQRFQWGILERLAQNKPGDTAQQRKLGDYFAACMDEGRSEALGAKPLDALLARIGALHSRRDLPALLADLQREVPDAKPLFGFGAAQDYADSTKVIAFATAGDPVEASFEELKARARALKAERGLDLVPTVSRLAEASAEEGLRL